MDRPDWFGVALDTMRTAHALRGSLEPYLTAVARDPGPIPPGVIAQMRALMQFLPTTEELVKLEVAAAADKPAQYPRRTTPDPRMTKGYDPKEDRIG